MQRFEVEVEDAEYLKLGDTALLARLYKPRGAGLGKSLVPVLIEVHGGAWCRGTRLDEDLFNRQLAARGIVVVAIDFRMPPQATYPASLADIHHAVRWVKARCPQWGSRADLVGLMGVSSGAHQAILVGMRPTDPRYAGVLGSSDGPDARVGFAVLCWPVIDPLGRYRYALDLQQGQAPYPEAIDRVIPDHLKYWVNEDAMAEGSPLCALQRGEAVDTPNVLYIQGEEDRVHPRTQAEQFIEAYSRAGGRIEARWFAGEAESFVNKKPDSTATAQAADQITRFVHEQVSSNQDH